MNKKIIALSVVSALAFAACTEKKETVTEEPAAVEVVDKTAAPIDSVVTPTEVPEKNAQLAEDTEITVEGKITEINQGKDGYTAKIRMADGTVYFATISIPNMKDPKQYKKYNVGDVIKVKGKTFKVEADTMIKVEELY